MKHTPGPWTTLAGETAIRARGCTVAEVIPQPSGITVANARLIAAAPELLQTLQSIARMSAPGGRTLDDFMRDFGYICDAARAAIAKAGTL